MDVQKQIDYWRKGAEEDIAAAGALVEKQHPRQALFFGHLAIEKMLKAHVARTLKGYSTANARSAAAGGCCGDISVR
jgi:HEPN domain-containing protein